MPGKIKSYRELKIWQRAIELVKYVYLLIRHFPKEERYALIDQIRRSAISIPSNIAEGQARQYTAEFKQFLFISLGSLAELDTQMVLSSELGYIGKEKLEEFDSRIIELRKMIRTLISKLK